MLDLHNHPVQVLFRLDLGSANPWQGLSLRSLIGSLRTEVLIAEAASAWGPGEFPKEVSSCALVCEKVPENGVGPRVLHPAMESHLARVT